MIASSNGLELKWLAGPVECDHAKGSAAVGPIPTPGTASSIGTFGEWR